jgi:hypothetical protein
MKSMDNGRVILAAVLIGLGLLFLLLFMIPGLAAMMIIALGMLLSPFLWPQARRGLAALWIPGMILLTLGLVISYGFATGDRITWGFILLPTSAGLGLAFAAKIGRWGLPVTWVGLIIAISGLIAFSIFAFIFGEALLQTIGPIGLIVLGLLVLWDALRHAWRRPS